MENKSSCVIVIDLKLARGADFRFVENSQAKCFLMITKDQIFDKDGPVTFSNVLQFSGRSNRRRGIQYCEIIVIDTDPNSANNSLDAWKQLEAQHQ